jgi:hypothetical protein
VLHGGGDALRLLRGHVVRAEVPDGAGAAAERPLVLVHQVAGRVEDVEHRREVDVHPDAREVLPRAAPGVGGGRAGVARGADILVRQGGCAGQPADLPTLLVGHEQQPVRCGALRGGGPELLHHTADLAEARHVLAEEDHPGRLAGTDPGEQALRRREARVGVDDPLPGGLPGEGEREVVVSGGGSPDEPAPQHERDQSDEEPPHEPSRDSA